MEEVFDTLKYTKRAVSVGFSQVQAEFQAEEMAGLIGKTLVTRNILESELVGLEARMKSFHYQMSGTLLGGVAAIITTLEAVFHFFLK